MSDRLVPPHGSGGGQYVGPRYADPDETAGRALYRATADAQARARSRRVKLVASTAILKSTGEA